MTKLLPTRSDDKDGASALDWEALYPADPELMTSAEGDAKGLADLKQQTRDRNARRATS